MKKTCLTISTLLIFNLLFGQNCPNRIGDFILNETTLRNLPKICPYCDTKKFLSITSGDDFLTTEVGDDDLDKSNLGSNFYHELFYDTTSIGGWYTHDYANINDSVRVLFIPNYETDGMSIKNVLLKFYNDTLYYMRASLSKAYKELLFEKYKGQGYKSAVKKTKNACKNIKFQKYPNTHSEYQFSTETDSTTFAKMIFDFQITKDCEVYTDDRIEIFNLTIYLKELRGTNVGLNRFLVEKKARLKKEKEIKLERF